MADSDQAIRDIVAQLNPEPSPAAPVPMGVMPAPEVTPAMTVMLPQSAPQAAPVVSAPVPSDPAAGPTSLNGAPLSGSSAQWATTPPAADPHSWFNGGLGPSVQPSSDRTRLYSYSKGKDKPDDWTPPAPTMVAPAVMPLGAMAAMRPVAAPTLGQVLGRR